MLSKNKIKFLHSLSMKKNRDEIGLFIAEGEKTIREISDSHIPIQTLIGTEEKLDLFLKSNCEKILTTNDEIKKLSNLQTPQGILAVCEKPKHFLDILSLTHELTIVLDDVQDPGNMGTIIRLASWFGIKNIICSPHTVDCYNPKVIQSTMGAIAKVAVHYLTIHDFLNVCISNKIPVYGTFLNGANLFQSTLTNNGVIVMGNEGNGISSEIEKIVEHRLTIPSFTTDGSNVESLNVSIATAIICSEFRRQII